jgi:broad specificity phosphatase PhoE
MQSGSSQTLKHSILVRHAESTANAGLATEFPESTGITERGVAQAQTLTGVLPTDYPIVVSRYARTRQTFENVSTLTGGVTPAVWEVQEYTFLAQSRCGKSTAAERRPLVEEYWSRNTTTPSTATARTRNRLRTCFTESRACWNRWQPRARLCSHMVSFSVE